MQPDLSMGIKPEQALAGPPTWDTYSRALADHIWEQ